MQIDWDEIRSRRTHDELALRYGQQQESFYGDAGHFLFELLQNAEDALRGRDCLRRVRFALEHGGIRFSHYGRPFTIEDVDAVSYFNQSTKNETDIGKFGLGFKSVHRITDQPEIYSGAYSFAIKDYHRGFNVEPIDRDPEETIFVLPFKSTVNVDEIVASFGRLNARVLLFLREIEAIEWTVGDDASGHCLRIAEVEQDGVRRVRMMEERSDSTAIEETWLVFSREVRDNGQPVGHVEIAFRIAVDESGSEYIEAVEDSRLTAFFPMEGIDTRLGMLIQGPYRTTTGRDNVIWPDEWNRRLVAETAELLVEALRYLRDHGLLGVHVYEALPLERPQPDAETRFAPYVGSALFEAVHRAIENEPLLPAHRRGGGESWISASQAYLGTPELRNLVSRRQLAELWNKGKPAAWLDGGIAPIRFSALLDKSVDTQSERARAVAASRLYDYLINEHGVAILDSSSLVSALRSNETFFAKQPDSWMRRLYAFLLDHGPRSRYSYIGASLLRLDYADVPLIRLEDGTHVAPAPGSTPAAYLPTDPPSKFPNTVRAAVCSAQKARAFLESLGLQQPDRVDELIRNVLPGYRKQEDVTVRKYADDLREIAEVYRAATGESRQRLVEALRETPFVRAVDARTGEETFGRPGGVYARRLLDLFEGVPSVLIAAPLPRGVPAADADRLFAACGVARTLTAEVTEHEISRGPEPPRFSHDQLRALRRQKAGSGDITWERGSQLSDSMLRGLTELIEYLPALPPEALIARTRLLWDALCATAQVEGAFSGQYRWFRYGERSVEVDSASVDLLNRSEWAPDGAGRPLRPLLVSLDDLGWQRNAFLESKIKFRPPVLDTLTEEAGLDRSDIDLVREARARGMSNAEMRAKLGLDEPPPLPAATDDEDTGDEHAEAVPDVPAPPGRVPTPQPPTEPAPRAEPAPTEGGAGGKRTFRSYIEVREEAGDGAPDPDGLGHEQRMALEEAAIARIREREPSLLRTAVGNAGYDLYEAGGAGEIVRWVEVKSMRGGWDAGPVGLTHTQFGLAREKRGAYWLYVVEYAGDADRACIVRIPDPAGRASEYLFDDGWREAAEPEPPPR